MPLKEVQNAALLACCQASCMPSTKSGSSPLSLTLTYEFTQTSIKFQKLVRLALMKSVLKSCAPVHSCVATFPRQNLGRQNFEFELKQTAINTHTIIYYYYKTNQHLQMNHVNTQSAA